MKKLLCSLLFVAAALFVAVPHAGAQSGAMFTPGASTSVSNFGGPGDSISQRGIYYPFLAPASGQGEIYNATSNQYQYQGGENVVTYSATPTFLGTVTDNYIQLTGNVTSSTLAAGLPGEFTRFIICQDATGSRTFTWPTTVYNGGTIGSTASKCSIQDFVYSAALSKWVGASIAINQ